jgi:hypothetical protein
MVPMLSVEAGESPATSTGLKLCAARALSSPLYPVRTGA